VADTYREVAGLALDAKNVGFGMDFDVEMAADVDQLGADIAHGAIIGREGLVQLGHMPADGRFLLNQVDLEALIGQIQGSLNAGDAAANHHNRAGYRAGRRQGRTVLSVGLGHTLVVHLTLEYKLQKGSDGSDGRHGSGMMSVSHWSRLPAIFADASPAFSNRVG
jgi:hypothetical protein